MRRSRDGHTCDARYTFAVKGAWAEKEQGLLNDNEACTLITSANSRRKKREREKKRGGGISQNDMFHGEGFLQVHVNGL